MLQDVNDFSPSISSNLQAQTIPEDFVGYQASVSQPTTLNFVFTGTDGDQPVSP
ncbi:hypothetical protein DPMN_025779 [Dreissena polymorpha]|uniref:Cadherin domain-containing protein n=1 Tax=Dreissena polymorpha TaxID=45954 RepID=A0A9D4LS43_DREPO|nr:hypothetical protein DPMN_025779 [Dreissena polymorpha]